MRPLTVVIPSYQRRQAIEQLMGALRMQILGDPEIAENLDVVVVLDGSDDGSAELLEELELGIPMKVLWQRNRGRSAARNAGLNAANGEIVWFLDDDVVPLPGLIRHHRESHEIGEDHVLVGPYPLLMTRRALAPNKPWDDVTYDELCNQRRIETADRFWVANTSGPAHVFRSVGGFDEGFTDWGCEDVEFGFRLLESSIEIRFDPTARAEHQQQLTRRELLSNAVSNGRNLVRAVKLHPELTDHLMPSSPAVASRRFGRALAAASYRCLPVKSVLLYRLAASSASLAAAIESGVTKNRSQRALYVAMVASTLAGIAEADPSGKLVARKLGIEPRQRRPADSLA